MIFMPPHDVRLGRDRRADRRCVWRAGRMRRYSSASRTAATGRLARAAPARPRPHRPRLERLAAHREARCRSRRSATTALVHDARGTARTLRGEPGDAAGERAALAAPRRRPQRPALGGGSRGPLLHAADDARPSPRRHARAPARRRRGASATACTSSSTRSRRASCSTTTARGRGVDYLQGRAPLPRRMRQPSAGAGEAREVRAPREVILPAAPSTRRSC